MKQDVVRFTKLVSGLIASLALFSSCEKSGGSFSLAADSSQFQQSAIFVPRKLDVLFVIDNSGSMQTSQANLAQNFPSFINYFKNRGYDFRLAITTTDAYYGDQFVDVGCSLCNVQQTQFRASSNATGNIRVFDNNTSNLEQVFSDTVKVGINGSGDERAFSSFKAALNSPLNTNFHRTNAYLSVIIVSDSDDFSHDDINLNESYSQATLHPITTYVNFLKNFTRGNASTDFSVSTIGVLEDSCKNLLNQERKISTRYMALSDATGGTKNSLCNSFDTVLNNISAQIASNVQAQFQLNRAPIISTIRVIIDGVIVPQDALNGWTYDAATKIVTVHGSYSPQSGASITINFDPESLN